MRNEIGVTVTDSKVLSQRVLSNLCSSNAFNERNQFWVTSRDQSLVFSCRQTNTALWMSLTFCACVYLFIYLFFHHQNLCVLYCKVWWYEFPEDSNFGTVLRLHFLSVISVSDRWLNLWLSGCWAKLCSCAFSSSIADLSD